MMERRQIEGQTADMIARQQRYGQISEKEMPSWIELLSTYYRESPAVRDQYKRFERGYDAGVRRLLGIDRYEAELSASLTFSASDG